MKKWSLKVFCNLLSVDSDRAHTNLAPGHIYKEKALRRHSSYGTIFLALFLLVLSGCKDTLANLQSKPTALGRMNEIVAICDQKIWDSTAQDSLLYYFAGPYPIMPAPEPLFDIRHFTTEELNQDPLRKELRTYVIMADLSDSDSPTTRMVKADLGEEAIRKFNENPEAFTTAGLDKWARGQLVVYVVGKNIDNLGSNVVKAFPRVSERIRAHDEGPLFAQTYMNGQSSEVRNLIAEEFGFQIDVPGDYQVAIKQDNFIWIRKDNRDLTSNIAIRAYDYKSEDQLALEGLLDMRNRMGVRIQGSSVGSFMQTNSVDLPVYTYRKELDGRFTVESRGIWEMTEDFLGGPFVNYAIVDGDKIIVIDTFVYAPGKDKRDYVQELELVIKSLTFG